MLGWARENLFGNMIDEVLGFLPFAFSSQNSSSESGESWVVLLSTSNCKS